MSNWLAWPFDLADRRAVQRETAIEQHLQAVEEQITLLGERLAMVEAALDAIADFRA